ncbi:hypothetical protein CesoFtcFv8_021565 [Champsocephalus esox]|uniref:Kinesin motor domain-containing protein n=1 Tax=Champsocephalus esox TaxID=159716 RepID=A0AAN8B9Q5_9TELE|nr:hypothetical protein CesoFtcFv8_021565 [Champsocephalus esox]
MLTSPSLLIGPRGLQFKQFARGAELTLARGCVLFECDVRGIKPIFSVDVILQERWSLVLGGKPEREGSVVVDDIKRDLLEEFNALPAQEGVQTESLQVFLRVRPLTNAERESRDSQQHVIHECVSIEGPDTVVLRAPRSCQSKSLPQTAQRFTFTQVTHLHSGSSLSTDSSVSEDGFCLDVDSNVRFSVWVSFCEIYNDNIHDLLEQVPGGQQRRTALRLSQDVKGNSFIKDLRWVQASSSEEACRVMKIGRKNQSFSSTRLNSLSSRSHSIFSIRVLRIADAGVPRVLGISELALCDLAGSERCSRTQNSGERLKESGNINTSLLTLGKCISAMRANQQAKVQHHVPFRESKLTHFLQFFFCGAGRVSMVVNISRNAACFDETLNVLKFSALAQKVVLLSSKPPPADGAPRRSALEVSLIMDEAEQRGTKRKSSMVAWETSLEDVMEDGEEEEEEEEEESPMEGTVLEAGAEEDEEEEEGDGTIFDSNGDGEAALRLLLEAEIREEVSSEFMELYNTMRKDYSERLEKEKELLEERADKRVEILKKLVSKTSADKKEQADMLETEDLEKIREEAHTAELEALRLENQRSHDQLQERVLELMELSEQKDDVINKLQSAMEDQRNRALVEEEEQSRKRQREEEEEQSRKRQREEEEERRPAKKRVLEDEIWRLQEENERREETIRELRRRGREEEELRERRRGREEEEEMRRREETKRREEETKRREEETKKEQILLQQKVQELTDLDSCARCDSVFYSLEAEQRESGRLKKENKALINGIFTLQTEVTSLQTKLKEQTDSQSEELNTAKARLQDMESQSEELNTAKARLQDMESQSEELNTAKARLQDMESQSEELNTAKARLQDMESQSEELNTAKSRLQDMDSQSEELNTAKSRLQDMESQSEEKAVSYNSLTQEVKRLRQEVKEEEPSRRFVSALQGLQEESQAALQRSAEKSQLIQDLQEERSQLQEERSQLQEERSQLQEERSQLQIRLDHSENRCAELNEELSNQRAAFSQQLQGLRAELESERGALRERLQEQRAELLRAAREKEELLEECRRETEALREELERLKEELQSRQEEELQSQQEEEEQEVVMPVVQELKEELQKLKERREEEEVQELKERREEEELQSRQEEEQEEEELQSREEQEEQEEEEVVMPVVQELKEELQKLKERREERELDAVRREMQRLEEERGGAQDVGVYPLRPNMIDRKKTTGRKRKSCENLVSSENKRNRGRGNTRTNKQEKCDGALQKLGDLIHSSPSVLGSTAKSIMGLVSGHSVEKEAVQRPKRGRRKLFKMDATLQDSPDAMSGRANEEKESDHLIIKRQLRSKTCRK